MSSNAGNARDTSQRYSTNDRNSIHSDPTSRFALSRSSSCVAEDDLAFGDDDEFCDQERLRYFDRVAYLQKRQQYANAVATNAGAAAIAAAAEPFEGRLPHQQRRYARCSSLPETCKLLRGECYEKPPPRLNASMPNRAAAIADMAEVAATSRWLSHDDQIQQSFPHNPQHRQQYFHQQQHDYKQRGLPPLQKVELGPEVNAPPPPSYEDLVLDRRNVFGWTGFPSSNSQVPHNQMQYFDDVNESTLEKDHNYNFNDVRASSSPRTLPRLLYDPPPFFSPSLSAGTVKQASPTQHQYQHQSHHRSSIRGTESHSCNPRDIPPPSTACSSSIARQLPPSQLFSENRETEPTYFKLTKEQEFYLSTLDPEIAAAVSLIFASPSEQNQAPPETLKRQGSFYKSLLEHAKLEDSSDEDEAVITFGTNNAEHRNWMMIPSDESAVGDVEQSASSFSSLDKQPNSQVIQENNKQLPFEHQSMDRVNISALSKSYLNDSGSNAPFYSLSEKRNSSFYQSLLETAEREVPEPVSSVYQPSSNTTTTKNGALNEEEKRAKDIEEEVGVKQMPCETIARKSSFYLSLLATADTEDSNINNRDATNVAAAAERTEPLVRNTTMSSSSSSTMTPVSLQPTGALKTTGLEESFIKDFKDENISVLYDIPRCSSSTSLCGKNAAVALLPADNQSGNSSVHECPSNRPFDYDCSLFEAVTGGGNKEPRKKDQRGSNFYSQSFSSHTKSPNDPTTTTTNVPLHHPHIPPGPGLEKVLSTFMKEHISTVSSSSNINSSPLIYHIAPPQLNTSRSFVYDEHDAAISASDKIRDKNKNARRFTVPAVKEQGAQDYEERFLAFAQLEEKREMRETQAKLEKLEKKREQLKHTIDSYYSRIRSRIETTSVDTDQVSADDSRHGNVVSRGVDNGIVLPFVDGEKKMGQDQLEQQMQSLHLSAAPREREPNSQHKSEFLKDNYDVSCSTALGYVASELPHLSLYQQGTTVFNQKAVHVGSHVHHPTLKVPTANTPPLTLVPTTFASTRPALPNAKSGSNDAASNLLSPRQRLLRKFKDSERN